MISVLKESNEISKKVSKLLKNHIDDFYPKYKRLYVKIISSPEIEENLRNIVREKYLKNFNKESFDSNDREFFEYHIKQQNTDKDIFKKLLTINVNKLLTLRDDNEQLDMFHYINSEMGSYLQCLISLFNQYPKYTPQIIQKIDSVDDFAYKELAQGILLYVYDWRVINITYHTFLGFSYSHSVIDTEVVNIFKDVVKNILKEKIKDNQILDRVYLVALDSVDPTIDSFSLSKNNYGQMINIIFTEDYEFRYSKQWLRELFQHSSRVNYLETISNLFHREDLKKDKLYLFIKELDKIIGNYSFKLSLHRIKYNLNRENNDYFNLIRDFFLVLLKHDKLENDIFYFETVKDILPQLSSKERLDVLREIQRQSNCTPPEIEELQRIIVN